MENVLLGFSGGVDSTASAVLLRDAGYDVHLLMLDTTGNRQQIEKAYGVAAKLGMELDVVDIRRRFRETVVDYFTDSYCRGETPAPCSVCNPEIKCKTLYNKAMEYGCSKIATGHYFRVVCLNEKYYVAKGADPVKDQSYFLWSLPQCYLAMALTPMGDKIKSDVKRSHGDLVADSESMGVCFLEGRGYGDFLRDNIPSITPGLVADKYGNAVGSHDGCALYTIGQKRGFECSVSGAVVTCIDAARNILTVGVDADLYSSVLELNGCRIVDLDRLLYSSRVTVKIRGIGRNPEGYVKVTAVNNCDTVDSAHSNYTENDQLGQSGSPDNGCLVSFGNLGMDGGFKNDLSLRVELSDHAWAAAKGQPVVFYEDDIVLGGGYLQNSYKS